MLSINGLPNEIIFLIFVRGCENEGFYDTDSDLRTIHGRRPKKFAALARSICSEWKNMIDNPSHTRFWIVRFHLGFASDWEDGSLTNCLLQLTRAFPKLRAVLGGSRGSDLFVRFSWLSERQLNAINADGPENLLVVFKLFTYGMKLVIPFSSQIVSLTLNTKDHHVTRQFIDLISISKEMRRLVEFKLLANVDAIPPAAGSSNTTTPRRARRELSLGTPLARDQLKVHPEFIPLVSRPADSKTIPISHLWLFNLDVLELSSLDWLIKLVIPPRARRLILFLSGSDADTIPAKLASHQSIFCNLTSLEIICDTRFEADQLMDFVNPISVVRDDKASLPNLKELTMQTDYMMIVALLINADFPYLKKATLRLNNPGAEIDPDDWGWLRMVVQRSSLAVPLESLAITSPVTAGAVALLDFFEPGSPTQLLEFLRPSDAATFDPTIPRDIITPLSDGILSEFARFLMDCSPRILRIEEPFAMDEGVRFILGCISSRKLKRLEVANYPSFLYGPGWWPSACDFHHPDLPFLNEIHIKGPFGLEQRVRPLLRSILSADALQNFTIETICDIARNLPDRSDQSIFCVTGY